MKIINKDRKRFLEAIFNFPVIVSSALVRSLQSLQLRENRLVALFHEVELGVLPLGQLDFDAVNRIK